MKYLSDFSTSTCEAPYTTHAPCGRYSRRTDAAALSTSPPWSDISGPVGGLPTGTAKGAVHGFTRSLSKESGEYGIHVNAVSPGALTRPVKASTNNFPDEAASAFSPELVAPTVARLAHPDTDVNGEVFTVPCGLGLIVLRDEDGRGRANWLRDN
jgi:NAD(P)-dependent dehydrogenase (short-subunit alcohol dehydrogenase family)